MIDFGIDSKLYKISNTLYNLMKINLMVILFSMTIVGLGSSIATGFYELNQVYKKGNNTSFIRFLKGFKENFRNGLFFTAPVVFILYVVFKNFAFNILNNSYYKYSYILFAVLLLSYMFSLLVVTGMVNMSIKNSLVYGGIIYIKQLIILILSTVFTGVLLKFLFFKYPVILIVFNWIIPILVYYSIFQKIINDKMYLQGEEHD